MNAGFWLLGCRPAMAEVALQLLLSAVSATPRRPAGLHASGASWGQHRAGWLTATFPAVHAQRVSFLGPAGGPRSAGRDMTGSHAGSATKVTPLTSAASTSAKCCTEAQGCQQTDDR